MKGVKSIFIQQMIFVKSQINYKITKGNQRALCYFSNNIFKTIFLAKKLFLDQLNAAFSD